jgi:hypothetical protein
MKRLRTPAGGRTPTPWYGASNFEERRTIHVFAPHSGARAVLASPVH